MRHRLCIVVMALTLIFGSTGGLRADSSVVRITDDPYEDNLPQIKGNYVVWQRSEGGSFQIFLYDVTAGGVPIQISNDPTCDHLNPQTDGQYVVWWSDKPTGAEVWLYDIGTGTPIQISPSDGYNHYLPVVSSGRVAWVRYSVGDVTTREIFLYDVLDPPARQITDNGLNDGAPRINDQYLSWIQTDADQNSTVFVRDLSTGDTQEASDPSIWGISPQKDGSLSVSLSHDGEDWEVILKDAALKQSESITNNRLDDRHPRLSENKIVWVAGEGKMSEIYLAVYTYLVALTPGQGAVLSRVHPPTFAWASVGYDKFKVEFSGDSGFPTTNTLSLPAVADDWLSETSFSPTKEQWELVVEIEGTEGLVYWRVKGMDADENVAFSDPLAFTFVGGEVVNVTIGAPGVTGDGDSGGVCFIGTAVRSLF